MHETERTFDGCRRKDYPEHVFDAVPYRLLVRRVGSGDCDKIGDLYALVEPELTAFCLSLTGDEASARRAADHAFCFASERLVSQSVSAAGFRSMLLGEAKGRSYELVGLAVSSSARSPLDDNETSIDLVALQSRLESVRPETLSSADSRLTWRSRMTPSTAVSVVLIMVVMVEMAALSFDIVKPDAEASKPRDAQQQSLTKANPALASSEVAESTKSGDPSGKRDEAANDRSVEPKAETPSPQRTDSALPSTSSEASKPANQDTADAPDAIPETPVPVPEVQLPKVDVNVNVGPVDVNLSQPNDSGILPSTSACVGSTCLNLP